MLLAVQFYQLFENTYRVLVCYLLLCNIFEIKSSVKDFGGIKENFTLDEKKYDKNQMRQCDFLDLFRPGAMSRDAMKWSRNDFNVYHLSRRYFSLFNSCPPWNHMITAEGKEIVER